MSNQLQQPKVASSEMEALAAFYDCTGGNTGVWDYGSMESAINWYYYLGYDYYDPGLIGREWNFTKSVQGAYLEDPCPNATSPPFMGINCSCDALACYISAIVVPSGNLAASTIPPALGNLKHVSFLELSENAFYSRIPDELMALQQLQILDLDSNLLDSSIPNSLGTFLGLRILYLFSNQLTSSIPASLGNLKQLEVLDLDSNFLSSSIPESLGNLQSLVYLYLFGNQLTSSIPPSLGNLVHLEYLYLDSNSLSGLIPLELGDLVSLNTADMSGNSFAGPIPASFGRLTRLTHLKLDSNALSGIVPPELANLVNLQELLLHGNHLGSSMGSAGENAFSFINPAKQVNLTVLDISSNAFKGPLSESIFALPKLEIFAAGSNCFSGTLPSNLCDVTKLRVLAIAGLSSGESCRRVYWKDTMFSTMLGFDGFGADHFMQGSLPQCVYGMPNLSVLSAAGNAFHGQAPSLGCNISASLQQIDVSRNRLTGSITAAMLTETAGYLQMLNMSYNRISGDLSAFSAVGGGLSFNTSVALSLEVNRLSGAIPQSLRSPQQISILTGNVFECSDSRQELPERDTPAIDSYQCYSKPMNNMMYAFAAFAFALIVTWEMLYRRSSLRFHFHTMRTWLLVADGAGVTSKEFRLADVSRYSRSLSELRRFVCIVGVALLIVLIVYGALSGDRYRTLEHTYLWVTTAAYMTGSTSTAWLLTIGMCMTTLTCYLVTENIWRTKAADVVKPEGSSSADHASSGTAQSSASESRWMWWRLRLLPILRIIVLISVVWGVIAAANVWYLKVLLNGSPQTQEEFKVAFAAFKLIWTLGITPMAFRSKLLFFGLEDERHNAFIDFWLGGEVNVLLAFHAVSTFFIPLLVVMVNKVDCYRNIFIAAAPIEVQFTLSTCFSFYSNNMCAEYGEVPVVTELRIPFLYNYTCSSSIIRAYVPLYQQMLMMLIAISCVQILYLCLGVSALERSRGAEPGKVSGCTDKLWGLIEAVVTATMPMGHLMFNSSQRMGGYKDGVIFGTLSRVWITRRLPAQFSNLLILVTFGVWAPLLGAIAVLAIVLDTYVSQLVIGRFLVVELGVVQERKEELELGLVGPKSPLLGSQFHFTPTTCEPVIQNVQDCNEPWGAVAVLKEVEEQCTHWPASVLAQGRTVLVVLPAITMAFLILDVINGSDIGDAGPTYRPCILLMCYACVLEFSARLYKRYKLDRSRQSRPDVVSDKGGAYKVTSHGDTDDISDAGIVLTGI